MLIDSLTTRYICTLAGYSSAISHRCWDGECVVFIAGAGDTLLLTRTAWEVLAAVSAEADGVSFGQLVADLGCSDPDDELVSLFERTLEHFESLQLIERLTA